MGRQLLHRDVSTGATGATEVAPKFSDNLTLSPPGGAHCTEIDFALSFGAVIVKMIDLSKTESRDFFGIILGQENSQKLHVLSRSC